ncbi:MAG TPA: UxaA family hydrolase [Chloroflexota bacterium]|nr:UxaA family hydrolase [Chloroflexota bacterium]
MTATATSTTYSSTGALESLPRTFSGYRRPDGQIGIRNHLMVVPATASANTVARRIAAMLPGSIALPVLDDDAEVPQSIDLTERTLAGAAASPNAGASIIVGLSETRGEAERIVSYARALAPGKPIEGFAIDQTGGSIKAISRGVEIGQKLMPRLFMLQREEASVAELIIGTECGGSDATSGMASNPTVGAFSDILVDFGGTTILSETTELMGAEHVLARRARDESVAKRIFEIVANVEKAANAVGATVAGGNPTPGNMAGGLTTIEEKSLGCTYKAGTRTIQDVLDYGQRPTRRGLHIMDTPGHDCVSVSAKASAGGHMCIFTTGRGTALGNAVYPVLKVCANPETCAKMSDNIDFDASPIVLGLSTKDELGPELYKLAIDVCNGQLTCAELIGHQEFCIHRHISEYL